MSKKSLLLVALASIIVAASIICSKTTAEAATKHTLQDDSIYDVLVDRFFNSNPNNDYGMDSNDTTSFLGGDFAGITAKRSYFEKLGFTIVSIGSIFEAKDFRGQQVTDYRKLQKHFGTASEYDEMERTLHKANIQIMIDFPINGVSKDNHLARKGSYKVVDGDTINWRVEDKKVRRALTDAAIRFVERYKVDAIRFTSIKQIDTAILNDMIDTLRKAQPHLKIVSNERSNAHFDWDYSNDSIAINQQIFKTNDGDSSAFINGIDEKKIKPRMIDNLDSARITYFAAEENMFPPTRIKMAIAANLFLPGVPVMTYGTEIAMNGKTTDETLQNMEFRTKEDIIDKIGQLQTLRNSSQTLRRGAFKMIENNKGFIIFERSSAKEKWFVVINNTSKTQNYTLSKEIVGYNKELHGMFENDTIRMKQTGEYNVAIDREIVEVFQVKNNVGFNKPYMIALLLVYVLFVGFIVLILKRGKNKKSA